MNIESGRHLLRMVRQAARRLTVNRAARVGGQVGTLVMAGFVVLALAGAVVPLTAAPFALAVGAAVAAVLAAGLIAAVFRPVVLLDAARALDFRLRLEERVSTAVEVLTDNAPAASSLASRVISDAEHRLSAADIPAVTSFRIPRSWWWVPLLAVVLLIWTMWLRGVTIPGTPAHRTSEVIRKEGQRIEQFARTLAARTRTEHMPATRRLAPQIRDLGTRLQRERLDRAEALARVAELSQQLDQTRREIHDRLDAARPSPSAQPGLPPQLLRRQSAQRQIRQLQELLSRLRQDPQSASRDALQRLGQISASGEGTQPAKVQQQLQQAREQLRRGNVSGAGEALNEALRELEGLEGLLADAEGIDSAQKQLARTRSTLAGGPVENEPEAGNETPQASQPQAAPGQNRPSSEQGDDVSPPPQGPNEGTTAGTGKATEKLGAPTPRLQVDKAPGRIRGLQAEGPAATSEIIGAGRPGGSRAQVTPVSPSVVARADQAMTRSPTPARYREIVRRYFQRLARLR